MADDSENHDQIEMALNLWHSGVGAAEIGRQFDQSRDWTRRIVRKAAIAGDCRARPHGSGNKIGAERIGYVPKTRKYYSELERQRKLGVNRE